MPKYMLQASYTAEGLRGLMKDSASGRRDSIQKAMKSLGGKLDSMHYCFGKQDVVIIVDLPDNMAAAGFATQASSTGLTRVITTPLLTVNEADKALKVKSKYRSPGTANK